MKKLVIFIYLFSCFAFSQGEANIWYFGENAGLDFNSGNPVPLLDGQINTQESCGSISDASGQLLFYTDGRSVWNRNHVVMPNGTGLLGHESASQSGTIVRKPGSNSLYYIFTTDRENGPNGLRYTVVDMSLDGGMGVVTSEKNILVFATSMEAVTVIKKPNDIDYWVVSHGWNNNNFYAYSLTASGLSTIPITSSVGPIITGSNFNAAGNIKISPSATKLVFTSVSDIAQLYDFNSMTGVISNPITLSTETGELYGVEFSPDESRLYVANSFYKVYQYDLTAANIPNSKTTIYNGTRVVGGLQMASNGKIYIAVYGYGQIGVINNPNLLGVGCDLQIDSIDLGGRISSLGLPSFNRSFFDSSFRADNACLGSTTQFSLISTTNVSSATWNFGDGSPTVNALNASHTYANAGNYMVSVSINSSSGTFSKSKQITISATPLIANSIGNQSVCGSANMNYDLSQFTTTLLGSQSATVFGVGYFLTGADAINHVNQLPNNNNLLQLGTTVFHAKIYNLSNTSCYVLTSFSVTLFQQPVANALSDYVICESLPYDNLEQFDLSIKNNSLLNGQNPADFTITYHSNSVDANNGSNALPILYTNIVPQELLFARITNVLNANCFATTSFNIKVVQQPIVGTVTDFVQCDDASNDGIALFDLSQKTNEILNGQSSAVFQVYYYLTIEDAQNDINRIAVPQNNTSTNQIIFYRIQATGNSNCSAISNFKLVVSRKPVANVPSNYFQCDDVANNGLAFFNLNSVSDSVLGNQNAAQYSISYHLTQAEADTGSNALATTTYQNISNPQTLFVRIENNQNATCFATTSFQIGLYQMPIANQPQNLFVCDDETNDGKAVFDLSQQDDSVLGAQNEADFFITYHSSLSDAQSGLNDLATTFTSISNQQIIYSRIENKLSSTCFAVTSFTLFVKPKPILALNDSYSICEGNTITITAPSGFSSYNWSNGGTTSTATFAIANTYSLTVTQDYGDITCSTLKDVVIYNSNKATITKIITSDWTDNQNSITVEVSGDGDYEYALNGNGYQNSKSFTNLSSGDYTVCINDKKGCGYVCEDVFLLNYPKFFTPNGDGYNDFWRIKYSSIEPNMQLKIFDRYGKLLSVLGSSDFGWDGIYNGYLLPADDYWFIVKRQNGKEFKGHFTLKR